VDLVVPAGGWPDGRTRLLEAELPQPARYDVNGESYYLQDAAFLHWVTGGVKPPNEIGAALIVQRLMDALYRSAREGGPVVRMTH
jgi:predicted dehydrogenase